MLRSCKDGPDNICYNNLSKKLGTYVLLAVSFQIYCCFSNHTLQVFSLLKQIRMYAVVTLLKCLVDNSFISIPFQPLSMILHYFLTP